MLDIDIILFVVKLHNCVVPMISHYIGWLLLLIVALVVLVAIEGGRECVDTHPIVDFDLHPGYVPIDFPDVESHTKSVQYALLRVYMWVVVQPF